MTVRAVEKGRVMGGKRYRLTGVLVVAVGLFALAACNEPVAGSAGTTSAKPTSAAAAESSESSESDEPAETTTTTARKPKTATVTVAPRTSAKVVDQGIPTVDQSAPAQYCDRPFKGALGKDMLAVVVETPTGILDCEKAAAILFDYYAARREPKTGLAPYEIGPLKCNQVAEPDIPQVVCADEDNLIYSMWPQT